MFINQILEPDRIEDVIDEEWFQPLPMMVAPDPVAEFHESIAAIKDKVQGCRATFRGKTWVVLNADTPLTAFHWLARGEIQGNDDAFDWGGLVTDVLERIGGRFPMAEMARRTGVQTGTWSSIRRRLYVPSEKYQKILLNLAREYGLIQEAA